MQIYIAYSNYSLLQVNISVGKDHIFILLTLHRKEPYARVCMEKEKHGSAPTVYMTKVASLCIIIM